MANRNDWGSTQITGLKELNTALKQLPDNIAKNVLRGAVRAGAEVVRKEAQAKAPVFTGRLGDNHPPPGTLKKAIYKKQQFRLSSLVQQTFHVGVRNGKGIRDKDGKSLDAFYWRFVEFGTSKMAAKPFMRPAFEVKKQEAIAAIKDYLAQRIPREVEKLKQGPGPKP